MGKKGKIRAKRREKKKEIIREEKTKKEAEEHNFPDIPEEIVVDIRSRLPLQSLPRFACVSKQWHSWISDFLAERIGGKMALVQSTLTSGTVTFHSIDKESHVKRVGRPWDKKIPWSKNPTIIGSCNGLLLMAVHDDLFLWNPLTKYFKKVLSYAPLGDDGFRIASGLCYDSSTNEYKAVMVFSHENQDSNGQFAVVGSFRSNNWRRVCFPYHFDRVKSGPVVNEHLHWHFPELSPRIIYFNIQTNEFKELPMPEPSRYLWSWNRIMGLGVLDGFLSFVRPENSSNTNLEVLAMKEFGIIESWTTMFIISTSASRVLGNNLVPFGYTKCGEVLMKVPDGEMGCVIIAYNPLDSSHRKISIQDHCDYVNAFMYEETLVTPIDYNWEEKELRGEATYVEHFLNRSPQRMRKRSDGNWVVCIMEKKEDPIMEKKENQNSSCVPGSYKLALLERKTTISSGTMLTSPRGV